MVIKLSLLSGSSELSLYFPFITRGMMMKIRCLLLTCAFIAGCSTNSQPSAEEMAFSATSLKIFSDVCLATAPSFSKAEQVAKTHGITEIMDMGFMKSGRNSDDSVGVQIKLGYQCVITTKSQKNRNLTAQFFNAVAPDARIIKISSKVSGVLITIDKKLFSIGHDREGGEAFILMKLDAK
jgi:hypothetical protein